ncbi:unnamed protein product [Rotaria magnacalcarata]|uniref:Uncharacterized protein n=1 Tax=Rotaria magnacalcarata TaxID=392030 RepID=A0A820I3Z2_9BILA|nr:unnamed protein product [Rotaria magnacalcarata]CAF4301142.1 unnamed protein product [Rotaria magnacalcarata]
MESDSSAKVIAAVSEAHTRWMSARADRVVLWTLPYYVDYASYNSAKMGEYDTGDTTELSWDSALRFVQYITRLRLQWVTSIPAVPFYPLNNMLFNGQNYAKMFKSFGAASGENFRFPQNLLSDGLHPNAKLAKLMWFGLHQAVNRVNTHQATLFSKDINQDAGPSTGSKKKITAPENPSKKAKGKEETLKRKLHSAPLYKNSKKLSSSVHARLADLREDDSYTEDRNSISGGFYGNLSWKASDSNLSQASTSKNSLFSNNQTLSAEEPWSWDYHHRVIRETRSKCYTQGLKEQTIAESKLSSMIREYGLRAAGKGMVDMFNQARLKWTSNAMTKINTPLAKIKLVQKDLTNLLTTEEEDEEEEVDDDDDEDDEEEDDD